MNDEPCTFKITKIGNNKFGLALGKMMINLPIS